MAGGTVVVRGLRPLVRDFSRLGRDVQGAVKHELKAAAEPVRAEAADRLGKYDEGSAGGLRVRVRGAGAVRVEQSKRKVTGKRGDYGDLQMRRALLPALYERRDEIEEGVLHVLDGLHDSYGF